MELLSINQSTVTSLFWAGNAEQKVNMFKATEMLVEKYQFKGWPTPQELQSDKQAFQHGTFNKASIRSLEIYNDGVIVRAQCNTSILEAFLNDLEQWMEAKVGWKRIETHRLNRAYGSEVLVRCDDQVLKFLSVYSAAASEISRSLKSHTGRDAITYVPAGIMFAADESHIAGIKPSPFRLERKFGSDFEQSIFYSAAPIPTDDHLALIKSLEKQAIHL
ncbi:hypothetical protein HY29_02840 [Hyphomonas beringensis]|uniref:Uncharacterized protein n=1 Tax=Hyphomonas beringensis TaxID=1280946 RepID=A0A062U6W9_9PROT|nr:hypothetical protein [Hyphomonas beringensis]KCZ54022.1 hypothetical protein HY29_02840 [Hyphomonas beringensis]